jgi:hypothetical protein
MPGRYACEEAGMEGLRQLSRCDALRETRKRRLIAIFWVSMIALAWVCSLVVLPPAWAQQLAGAARIVVNNVSGTLPTARERVVMRVGIDVIPNEVIDTAENSATLIAFKDNTQLPICPSSEIVLDRITFDPNPMLAFSLRAGCAKFFSGLVLKTALINTPSAQIRTSGTILTVTVSARGATTVSVAEGAVSVTGAGRSVTVAAGQSTLVLRGQAPTPPVPTPPEPPIVTEMNRLLAMASAQDFGTRAAARSPAVEAPTDAGTNTFTPNVDGKIQSEIAGDATPAFGPCVGSTGTIGSRGTHGACGAAGSNGTHSSAGSNGTH